MDTQRCPARLGKGNPFGSLRGDEYKGVRLAAPSYHYKSYSGIVNLISVYMVKRLNCKLWLGISTMRYAVVIVCSLVLGA